MRASWMVGLLGLLALGMAGCKNDADSKATPSPEEGIAAFHLIPEEQVTKETPKKPYTLALVSKKQNDPYYGDIVEAAKKRAKELNINLQVSYGDTEAAQEDLLKKAVAAKADALLLIPVDSKQILSLLAGEEFRKIKTVTISDDVHPTVVKKSKVIMGGFIGNDPILAGKTSKPIYTAMGKGEYLRIRSTEKNTTGAGRNDGMYEIGRTFHDFTMIVSPPLEDASEVKPLVEKTLREHPKLKAISATDDGMALAAREAIGDKPMMIFGFGGCSKALDAVKTGKMNGTINCHPDRMGAGAVGMAVALLNGSIEAPARVLLPAEVVMGPGSAK